MSIRKGFGMAKSYAQALVSRGFSNKKTDPYTKKLRVLSCFGNKNIGGDLPPCEHLKESKTKGKFYCGGCGCGDRKGTWLISESEEYSKLDYPNLKCPLNMPGFSDYKVSSPEEAIIPVTRRYYIENIEESEVDKINVTINEIPEEMQKELDKEMESKE